METFYIEKQDAARLVLLEKKSARLSKIVIGGVGVGMILFSFTAYADQSVAGGLLGICGLILVLQGVANIKARGQLIFDRHGKTVDYLKAEAKFAKTGLVIPFEKISQLAVFKVMGADDKYDYYLALITQDGREMHLDNIETKEEAESVAQTITQYLPVPVVKYNYS